MTRQTDPATGVSLLLDATLLEEKGIGVAFSERAGGVSVSPYDSLNVAAHVGDDAETVDANRTRLLRAAGIESLRGRLTTAEQVHGERVAAVGPTNAGRGAWAVAGRGRPPLAAADAMLTVEREVPLMMFFADCVPVVLVATGERVGVAIAHAGWRGALARIAGSTLRALLGATGSTPAKVAAYVGPSVKQCCYEVDVTLMSRFANTFDTIPAVGRGLDLTAAVVEDLLAQGMLPERVLVTEACTADEVGRFFSYRASGVTGRHAALAWIAKGQ